MGRRSLRAKPESRPSAGRTGHASGFEALKPLRGTLAPPKVKGSTRKPRKSDAANTVALQSGAQDEDDAALFRAALADATALPTVNRVILERPKPLPQPRRREPEHEAKADGALDAPGDEDALFRFEMRDVVPIKDAGRVDPGHPGSRRKSPLDPHAAATFDPASLLEHLPSDVPPDDPRALLDWALQGTRPLKADNRAIVSTPPAPPHPVQRQADDRSVLAEALGSPLSLEDRLDTGEETAFLRPGIPRRVLTDLRRGRWVVQGQLDLHGLVRDEARAALATFLGESLHLGRRCVRLIHGKGLGSPGRIPVLKHLSRGWLAQREEILAFCQAPPHDGGGGALLILLRASTTVPGRASAQ